MVCPGVKCVFLRVRPRSQISLPQLLRYLRATVRLATDFPGSNICCSLSMQCLSSGRQNIHLRLVKQLSCILTEIGAIVFQCVHEHRDASRYVKCHIANALMFYASCTYPGVLYLCLYSKNSKTHSTNECAGRFRSRIHTRRIVRSRNR